MIKISFTILLAFLAFQFSNVTATEFQQRSSLNYIKFGGVYAPSTCELPLPNMGIGIRRQWNHYGFDASLNIGSLLVVNHLALKAVGLYYPFPERQNQFYWGLGLGLASSANIELYKSNPSFPKRAHITGEALIGYEFRPVDGLKKFIQLEVSQPLMYKNSSLCDRRSHIPDIAIMWGIGF